MTEILGFAMTLVIGLAMGLMGGGGSILAVPIFAYLFGFDEQVSTAYSLFVVGFCAVYGATTKYRDGDVSLKYALAFGIPSTLSVLLMRIFIIPNLAENITTFGDFTLTRRMLMFGVFAVLMILSARSMIFGKDLNSNKPKSLPYLLTLGLGIGLLTGFVGAGGGFIIVPSLVLLTGLDIKKAIGTSLFIIAFNSLIGFFLGDALSMDINWIFLGKIVLLAISGIVLGMRAARLIDGQTLKKGFGIFVIIMAIFIFTMEFIVG